MNKLRLLSALIAAVLLTAIATPSQAQLFGRKNDNSAVRVNELEERLRLLTGQVEQLSYQLRELQDQMRRMQEDNEYRFQQLENGKPGKRSDAGPGLNPDGSPRGSQLALPNGNAVTLPAEGSGDGIWSDSGGYQDNASTEGLPSNGPIDLSKLANGLETVPGVTDNQDISGAAPSDTTGDQIANLLGSGDPRTDYDKAYSYAVNGDYAAAEQGFQAFLETYPDNELAANAQYWLGESYLAQQNFRDAADAFLKTYTEHPGNPKSPDSLLKLGVSLRGLGEGKAACATFSELLNKFPNAAPAVLSQARDERKRAQCS